LEEFNSKSFNFQAPYAINSLFINLTNAGNNQFYTSKKTILSLCGNHEHLQKTSKNSNPSFITDKKSRNDSDCTFSY